MTDMSTMPGMPGSGLETSFFEIFALPLVAGLIAYLVGKWSARVLKGTKLSLLKETTMEVVNTSFKSTRRRARSFPFWNSNFADDSDSSTFFEEEYRVILESPDHPGRSFVFKSEELFDAVMIGDKLQVKYREVYQHRPFQSNKAKLVDIIPVKVILLGGRELEVTE